MTLIIRRIIKTHHDLKAIVDPWGCGIAADVVDDEAVVLQTEHEHHYDNGYTEAKGRVWMTGDHQTCYAKASIDYSGGTSYIWLDGPRVGSGPWRAPTLSGRYVRDGKPFRWDAEIGWMAL